MKRVNSRYKEQAEHLATRLRGIREERGLSQERLAAEAGLSVATIRKIEKGAVVEPGFFTVLSIADALGVTANDLVA
jgi:transcriptional regulator with XRE-family HTH domain